MRCKKTLKHLFNINMCNLQRFLRAPSWQPASWLRRPRVFHFNFVHSGLEETPESEEEASALWVSVPVALGRLRQLWAPWDVEVGLGLGRPGLNSCLSGSNALQGCFSIGFRMALQFLLRIWICVQRKKVSAWFWWFVHKSVLEVSG